MAPTKNPQPNIIGVFGLPGSGKTTLLSRLRLTGDTSPAHYDYYEGSEVIDSIVDGGLSAFKQMPHAEKQRHRTTAIRHIGDEARRSGKDAIVAGHFMLHEMRDESSGHDDLAATELQPVHTDADLATFTHVIYLQVRLHTIARQRAGDTRRAREALSVEELRRWQGAEMAGLFALCVEHGIVYADVKAGQGEEVRHVAELCAFWSMGKEGNLNSALAVVDKAVDGARLQRSKAVAVFDADRTLAPHDSGAMFVGEASAECRRLRHQDGKMGAVLKKIFAGPLGYTHRAFQQVSVMLEDLVYPTEPEPGFGLQDAYELTCAIVAKEIDMYHKMSTHLRQLSADPNVMPVVVTCGVRRVWEILLEREGLHVPVIGGGQVKDGYVVTPEVKAAIVDWLAATGRPDRREVFVYGDSPVDIPMMARADHAFVVVGDEQTRSSTMDAEMAKAFQAKLFHKSKTKRFKTRVSQVLPTSDGSPRPGLPIVQLEWPHQCAIQRKPSRLGSLRSSITDLVQNTKRRRGREMCRQIDDTEWCSDSCVGESRYGSDDDDDSSKYGYSYCKNEVPIYIAPSPAARLLCSPMRDASVAGPALQEAHVQAGRYLAIHLISEAVGLEEYSIRHVQGVETVGHRLDNEHSTLIVAMMRGGEPMARGVHQAFPHARFLHAKQPAELNREDLCASVSNILLVDSVVNTGKSVRDFVEHIRRVNSEAKILVVAGVVQSEAIEAIELDGRGEASSRNASRNRLRNISFGNISSRNVSSCGLGGVLMGYGGVRMVALRVSGNKYTGQGGTDTGNRLFNTTNWM